MWIKTITIIGLTLQFLSFWLAAPEILGSEWLKKTEAFIRRLITFFPSILMFLLGILLGFMTGSFDSFWLLLLIVPFMVFALVFHKQVALFLDRVIAGPLTERLILRDSLRFALLKIAAALFTIGFGLQVVAIALG